jgi:hypothetical protein
VRQPDLGPDPEDNTAKSVAEDDTGAGEEVSSLFDFEGASGEASSVSDHAVYPMPGYAGYDAGNYNLLGPGDAGDGLFHFDEDEYLS